MVFVHQVKFFAIASYDCQINHFVRKLNQVTCQSRHELVVPCMLTVHLDPFEDRPVLIHNYNVTNVTLIYLEKTDRMSGCSRVLGLEWLAFPGRREYHAPEEVIIVEYFSVARNQITLTYGFKDTVHISASRGI